MATPDYQDLTSAQTAVRFLTAKDPYHYTVDNRPLGDLNSNVGEVVDAAEAARRALLLDNLVKSALWDGFTGNSSYIVGLESSTASESVTIQPGALIISQALSATNTTQVKKIAGSPSAVTLPALAPSTYGNQIAYLVEGQFTSLGYGTTVPYEVSTNPYLPSTCFNGRLTIRIRPGVEAATGSAVPPSVASGWFGLYVVKSSRVVDNSVSTAGYDYLNGVYRIQRLSNNLKTTMDLNVSTTTDVVGGVSILPSIAKITSAGTYNISTPTIGNTEPEAFRSEFWIWNAYSGNITISVNYGSTQFSSVTVFDNGGSTVTKNATNTVFTVPASRMLKLTIVSALGATTPGLLIHSTTNTVY